MAKKKGGKKGGKPGKKSNAQILAEAADASGAGAPQKATKPLKKAQATDIVDNSKLSTAIQEHLGHPKHGIDRCIESLSKIRVVLKPHHQIINKIIEVFTQTFAPFRKLTDASQVSVKEVGTLITSLTEASRYVSAGGRGFFSKALYAEGSLPTTILDNLSCNIVELMGKLDNISSFFFHKTTMQFYDKFNNSENVKKTILKSKYQYSLSDYCPEKDKAALYKDVLELYLPHLTSKESEYAYIAILARYTHKEKDFDKVKSFFHEALRKKETSDEFSDACAIKYARYLLENDRPHNGIRKTIDLIKGPAIKELMSGLYDYYLAYKPVDLVRLKFPDSKHTHDAIEAALYTEALRIKVEIIRTQVHIDHCLIDLKRGKAAEGEEKYFLSPNTRDYIETRIISACGEYGYIEKGIEILESGLIDPLSENASIILKTQAMILYIWAGKNDKALEIEATIPRPPAEIEVSSVSDEAPEEVTPAAPTPVTKQEAVPQHAEAEEAQAIEIQRPAKKIKFTALDAIRVESTPPEEVSPEDWHRYHQFKKNQAKYSARKAGEAGEAAAADAPPPSWYVDGKKYSLADNPSIHALGNGIFGMIPEDIVLEQVTMNQFQNALAKGFVRRGKGENGIKFVKKSVIELKISGDDRMFTGKKYVNTYEEVLLIFDRLGNHHEVKALAHANDAMSEIPVLDIEPEAEAGAAADSSHHHGGDADGGHAPESAQNDARLAGAAAADDIHGHLDA